MLSTNENCFIIYFLKYFHLKIFYIQKIFYIKTNIALEYSYIREIIIIILRE